MFPFQVLAPTIILVVSLIIAMSMRGGKIPKNKKNRAKTITTTLITCMLLIGILGQIHPVKAEIPAQEIGSGTTYNATEYITGINTTTETYTTQNNFNNLQRETNFTATKPQNFNLRGNITITVQNLTAEKDSREIVKENTTHFYDSRDDIWISMSFLIKEEKVNITEVQIVFENQGPANPLGTFEIQGADSNLQPNDTTFGQIFTFAESTGWYTFQYNTPLTLPRGNYTCVLKDLSSGPRYYHWFRWNDSESGDNGTVFVYRSGSWQGPNATDLPLRLKILPLNPNNISEPLDYSSADQVDMKVNGTIVGADNIVSLSSFGTFVFTTNTSVIFRKSWNALFERSGVITVTSTYKANITKCYWNLTYSLESVSGGSATNYTGRTVNITGVRDNWTPISSTPANTTSSRYLTNITVVFSGEGKPLSALANLKVMCESPNYITALEVFPGTIYLGDTITVNATISPSEAGTVTFRLYDTGANQVDSTKNDSSAPYNITFDIPSGANGGTWTVVANYTNTLNNEAGFNSTAFTVEKNPSTITCQLSSSSITYGDYIDITGTISPTPTDGTTVFIEYNTTTSSWQLLGTNTTTGGAYSYQWYPNAGNYYVRASWNGNATYAGDTSDEQPLIVAKNDSQLTVSFNSSSIVFSDLTEISGHLIGNGAGVVGENIFLYYNGSEGFVLLTSQTTGSDGYFSYEWSPPSIGGFEVKVNWTGNENFNPFEITTDEDLRVDKVTPILSVEVSEEVIAGDTLMVYATLIYPNGDPINGAHLYFDFRVEYDDGSIEWYNVTSSDYKVTIQGEANVSFQTVEEMEGAEITSFVRFEGNEVVNGIVMSPTTGTVKVLAPSSPGGGDSGDGGFGIYLLLLGLFAVLGVSLLVFAQKRKISAVEVEFDEKEKIRRVMVVWESFALYDQIPHKVIAEGRVVDKELVSGFFTAIKYLAEEVAGTTLETMKVYFSHPYYFVYTGKFYCVLILGDKPSPNLEEKLLEFARIVEEKYGKIVEEEYWEAYASGLLFVTEIRLDLDEEVSQIFGIIPYFDEEIMKFFGLTPLSKLHEIVTIFLSNEEIESLKVRDDVREVLMTGRDLTDKLGKFPLEKLIQNVADSLGDIRIAHSAVLEALEAGLITVVGKPVVPKEE